MPSASKPVGPTPSANLVTTAQVQPYVDELQTLLQKVPSADPETIQTAKAEIAQVDASLAPG